MKLMISHDCAFVWSIGWHWSIDETQDKRRLPLNKHSDGALGLLAFVYSLDICIYGRQAFQRNESIHPINVKNGSSGREIK